MLRGLISLKTQFVSQEFVSIDFILYLLLQNKTAQVGSFLMYTCF